VSFGNTEQTCVNTCPEGFIGSPISVTVAADTIFASRLIEANAAAMAEACSQAQALRDLTPCTGGTEGEVVISAKTRSGTPALVGCPEFTDVSTPPRYYRLQATAGSLETIYYPAGGIQVIPICDIPPFETDNCTYTGYVQYDQATGVKTTGGFTTCDGVDYPGLTECYGGFQPACDVSVVTTATVSTRTGTNTCCAGPQDAFGFLLYSLKTTGVNTMTNSEEDTESDAIDRFRTANPYGGWAVCETVPITPSPTPLSCAPTSYELRETGREFAYEESMAKVDASLLTPGSDYTISCEITRTDLATMVEVVSGVIDVTGTASGGGLLSGEFDMPVDVGYAYRISNVTLIAL